MKKLIVLMIFTALTVNIYASQKQVNVSSGQIQRIQIPLKAVAPEV